MPYKISGKMVMVFKDGKWVTLKEHKSHAEALAHMRALMANVPEAKKGK